MTEIGQNLSSYERVYVEGDKSSKFKIFKPHKYFFLNGLILSIFIIIYFIIINNYKKKLLEKDKEIEQLKEHIFQNQKQIQIKQSEQKYRKIDDNKIYSNNSEIFDFEEDFFYDKNFII